MLGLSADQVRDRFSAFAGQKCSILPTGMRIDDPGVHLLRNAGRDGFSFDPECLATGGNSGFQAVNLAALAGAATIVLLGYDARDPRPGEEWHWFGEHPRRSPSSVFRSYRQAFSRAASAIAAAGIRVVNATPGSAIDAFERASLETVLA